MKDMIKIFCLVRTDILVKDVPDKKFIICHTETEEAVIEKSDIGLYILSLTDDNYDLIVSLKDIKNY